MVSALNDASLFENNDAVTVADSGATMGNDKRRPALHQAVHTLLYDTLRTGINGAGRFVQNEHRRICNRRSGNRQQLTLSLAQ